MPELTVRPTAAVLGSGLLGATLVGACAHGRLSPAEGDDPRRLVPVGSTLELLRRLPVPGDA